MDAAPLFNGTQETSPFALADKDAEFNGFSDVQIEKNDDNKNTDFDGSLDRSEVDWNGLDVRPHLSIIDLINRTIQGETHLLEEILDHSNLVMVRSNYLQCFNLIAACTKL